MAGKNYNPAFFNKTIVFNNGFVMADSIEFFIFYS
jgi:hypothetical protein